MKAKKLYQFLFCFSLMMIALVNTLHAQRYLEYMNDQINELAHVGKLDSADMLNKRMFELCLNSHNRKCKNRYYINKILIKSYRMQLDSFITFLTLIDDDSLDPKDLLNYHIASSSYFYALHHTQLRIDHIKDAGRTLELLEKPNELAEAINQKLFILYYYSPVKPSNADTINVLLNQWEKMLPSLSTLNQFRYYSKKITLPNAPIGDVRLALDDMRDIVKSSDEPFYHYFYHILNYNFYFNTPEQKMTPKNFRELVLAEDYLRQTQLLNQDEYLMKSKFDYYIYNHDYPSILSYKNEIVHNSLGDADNSLVEDIAFAYDQVGKHDSSLLFLNSSYQNYKFNSRSEDAKNQSALMDALDSQRELLLEKNRARQQRYLMLLLAIGSVLTLIIFQMINKEKMNKSLSVLNEELARSNETLEDYVSLTTHDLRSPIASISSLSNPNYQENSPQDLQKNLHLIHNISTNSLNIVSGLAMYHNLKNNIPFELTEINLKDSVNKMLLYMDSMIKSNGFRVEMHIPDNLKIYGNKSLIKRLIQNLIENSLKFKSENFDRFIKIIAEPLPNNGAFITVTDNGKGIPQQNLSQIFQKRYKVNPQMPGSGLGLTFCEQIVEYHNGTIEVDSVENQYTSFIIKLKGLSPPL